MPLLHGYLLGLTMILFLGPVFFTLIQSTLQYGRFAGFAVAVGIALSDVAAIAICSAGAVSFFENTTNQIWIALIGGGILSGLGIGYLLKKVPAKAKTYNLRSSHYLGFFVKGFLVNFINPFVFLLWIGIISYTAGDVYSGNDLLVFLFAAPLGILTTDTLKVFLAAKLKNMMKPKILLKTYKIIGIILLAFGARLFFHSLQQSGIF